MSSGDFPNSCVKSVSRLVPSSTCIVAGHLRPRATQNARNGCRVVQGDPTQDVGGGRARTLIDLSAEAVTIFEESGDQHAAYTEPLCTCRWTIAGETAAREQWPYSAIGPM